eukprot:CAMPEP_0173193194 /NCGR_PEP_ID=MMETSP1141-20130122/13829_1 /TAXON_ID=483371 /ORGANISM="non described non described, Strain CCMP2298" /LENGTH=354 /DNA_ID=CAMNT_0014117515 /DNA_START=17 /DNA_END=1078 /DNA_ORIENTATION=-
MAGRKSLPLPPRKSLLRSPIEQSLGCLRLVGNLDLTGDMRGGAIVTQLQDHLQGAQFADLFDSALDAVYALPEADPEGVDVGVSDGELGGVWDEELSQRLDDLRKQVSSQGATEDADVRFLRHAHADDMLAVGCMAAEMFAGRPLMNRTQARKLAETGTGAAAGARAARFAYRHTADLPLALRRLVAILLQPEHTLRPGAAEVLQACVQEDDNKWSNRDYSLQRSGGSSAGFVDFSRSGRLKSEGSSSEGAGSRGTAAADDSLSHLPSKLRRHVGMVDRKEREGLRRSPRTEALGDLCAAVFPSYFKTVYRLVGDLKLCPDGLARMALVQRRLDDIMNLPLEALNLALRHLLVV